MSEATRDKILARFDLLIPDFIALMAQNMGEGSEKYGGDDNWKKGLPGHKSPINHALMHINMYQRTGDRDHLVHAACNLMMEFWLATTKADAREVGLAGDFNQLLGISRRTRDVSDK